MTGTILWADDREDTGTALVKLLRMQELNTVYAPSDALAVEWLASNTPDLVILHVVLPHTDGLGLLRIIRSEPRLSKLPILNYTGISAPEFREYALREGATDCCAEGAFDQILQRVAACLPTPNQPSA